MIRILIQFMSIQKFNFITETISFYRISIFVAWTTEIRLFMYVLCLVLYRVLEELQQMQFGFFEQLVSVCSVSQLVQQMVFWQNFAKWPSC